MSAAIRTPLTDAELAELQGIAERATAAPPQSIRVMPPSVGCGDGVVWTPGETASLLLIDTPELLAFRVASQPAIVLRAIAELRGLRASALSDAEVAALEWLRARQRIVRTWAIADELPMLDTAIALLDRLITKGGAK